MAIEKPNIIHQSTLIFTAKQNPDAPIQKQIK
jgi:hypothetical protein